MTTNRRAVGTLGFAAIAAVLAVSMIAMNLAENPTQAAAANKYGVITDTTTFVTANGVDEISDVILEYQSKAQDKQNVYSQLITECTTQTLVKASGGKHKETSSDTATAGALIWWTVSWVHGEEHLIDNYGVIKSDVWDETTGAVDPAYMWHICGQQMDLNVDLNPLITKCTEDQALAGLCVEDQLVFVCDVDPVAEASDECDQYVEIFLKNWGTHSAATFIQDIPAGTYWIKVWGDADVDLSDNVTPDDKTMVIIGKKILTNNPINIDKSG